MTSAVLNREVLGKTGMPEKGLNREWNFGVAESRWRL